MAKYVDGYVLAIPEKNLAEYKKMAEIGAKTWMKHGALDYKECVLEDKTPQHVEFPFLEMAKAKAGETVIFAYVVFTSREHRDAVNAKVMADPEMKACADMPMPFEMNRMSHGGFEVIVDGK